MSSAIVPSQDHPQFEQSDSEKLGDEITELCGYIYAATHHLLELIREFDEMRYWEGLGFQSCAHWLNFKCGFGMNSARERLRVAHALGGSPKISEKFSEGAISYSKVRAITRVANEANEEYLLMVATHGTAHHVERLVAQYRRAKKLEDAEFAMNLHEQREVTYYYDHDGCLVMKARIPADQGELIVKALEMAIDEQDVTAETSDDPEPIAARRADALCEIAETYMNNAENSGSTADRYQVIVHVTPEVSSIEDGPGVYPKGTWPAGTSRRIACDSSIVAIKEDKNGEPLSIGRRSRTIPPPIRRALRARDKGCRFPGCTNTRFVDGHHIKHWADGGETSLDNLIMLCRHHHHLVHEGGFVCEKTADGEVRFRDQREQALDASCKMPGIAANDDVQLWIDREFFEADIDSETCTARWQAGERMDWHAAVGSLFY